MRMPTMRMQQSKFLPSSCPSRPTCRTIVCLLCLSLIAYLFYHMCHPLTRWYISQSDMSDGSVKSVFRSTMTEEEKRIFTETLREFDAALTAANVTYFVIGGTLLGSYRHHGMIPWDDDSDVVIPWSQSGRALEALGRHDPSRFGIYAGLGVSLSSLFLPGGQVRFATKTYQWKFYSLAGSNVLLWPYRYPYVDIFFYEENATHLMTTSTSFPEVYDKRLVFPLVRRPFNGLRVAAPCDTGAFIRSLGVDPTTCVSSSFDHKVDIPFVAPAASVPCASLADSFPFVARSSAVGRRPAGAPKATNFTLETLSLRGKVLSEFWAPSCRRRGYIAQ